MNTNNNAVAPTGQIQGSADMSEVQTSSRIKRKDIILLNHGINLGIIYGFVDLGTHLESFPGSAPKKTRKLKILFEHPQLKQLFYEDDTERKSTVSSKDCSFTINDRSFLKQLIDAISGQILPVADASKYPTAKLIGQRIGVNIAHTPKSADPTIFYEKVLNVLSPNGLQVPHPFEPENKSLYFYIDKGGLNFTSQNFADLPKYFRDKIMESDEGKAHIARGGKFSENSKQEQGAQQQQQQQQALPQEAQAFPKQSVPIVMLPSAQFTREQYHGSGWTDDLLVQNGLAQWFTPPAPAPQSAPAPQGPPTPQGPSNPASFLEPQNGEDDDLPF